MTRIFRDSCETAAEPRQKVGGKRKLLREAGVFRNTSCWGLFLNLSVTRTMDCLAD